MSHYSINYIENGMSFLKELFPEAEANELNFCLFSTSGVHGTYTTLEEIPSPWIQDSEDHQWPRQVTFLVVHPRIVRMSYGNAKPESLADIEFLKKLRRSSWEAVSKIGKKDE